MNKQRWIMKIQTGLIASFIIGPAVAGTVTSSQCESYLGMQPSASTCQSSTAANLRVCVQQNMASQISTSGSMSAQLQATLNAATTLNKLNFACQQYAVSNPLGSTAGTKQALPPTANPPQQQQQPQLQQTPPPSQPQPQPQPQQKQKTTINWF